MSCFKLDYQSIYEMRCNTHIEIAGVYGAGAAVRTIIVITIVVATMCLTCVSFAAILGALLAYLSPVSPH